MSSAPTVTITLEDPIPSDIIPATKAPSLFTETTGEDIPMFYPFFKMVSDITEWPIQVFWISGALVLVTMGGIIMLALMKSMLLAGIASGVLLAAFSSMSIIPWWTLYVYILMAVTFIIYQRVTSV